MNTKSKTNKHTGAKRIGHSGVITYVFILIGVDSNRTERRAIFREIILLMLQCLLSPLLINFLPLIFYNRLYKC